jgi:hypothetical protein
MIEIDIFEENHRFSEKTRHPGPHSVVDAANLAASSRGSKDVYGFGSAVLRGLLSEREEAVCL